MPSPVVKLQKSVVGRSSLFLPDQYLCPFNIGLGAVLAGADTITYTVEHTFDDVWASGFNPATATWFVATSWAGGKTTNVNSNYAYPVSAISINIATIVKAGPDYDPDNMVSLYILQAGAR